MAYSRDVDVPQHQKRKAKRKGFINIEHDITDAIHVAYGGTAQQKYVFAFVTLSSSTQNAVQLCYCTAHSGGCRNHGDLQALSEPCSSPMLSLRVLSGIGLLHAGSCHRHIKLKCQSLANCLPVLFSCLFKGVQLS